ncbi:serine hydrolase domain-containing protein [Paenibacillus tarimensis]|uniref:serine hydrolase domain-containing protein n=1 Tax=Paenibacillus tarimensis TaxID=416012 RepID=UPI001F3D2E02|nr:serine hydrolase [Paenibacillus tarimensis]MCF2943387.1 beta-lactamase family protein [Paenibacillus tarimensis]
MKHLLLLSHLNTGKLDVCLKKAKVHGCLISIDNKLVYQFYKNKKMKTKQHKINSCTKSVISCLVGIAHDQGFIPDWNEPISTYFPAILEDPDTRKQLITVDHLLQMSPGFDWPEMGDWGGWPSMIHSTNWVRYVLERPLIAEPGQAMNYNSGCSHLLSAILQKTAGLRAQEFADRHLFAALEINDYMWHEDPQGVNIGGFGIHMTIEDMHKFGMLYLNNGIWKGKQLVSREWISRSTSPEHLTYGHFGPYGRHWWTSRTAADESYYFAMGLGGQYILVFPERQTVVTFASDTYGDTMRPLHIVRQMIDQEV